MHSLTVCAGFSDSRVAVGTDPHSPMTEVDSPAPDKGVSSPAPLPNPSVVWCLHIELPSRPPKSQQNRVGSRVCNCSLFRTLFPNNADCYGHLCRELCTPSQTQAINFWPQFFSQIFLLVD